MSLDELQAQGFQVEFHSHARAILTADFPQALNELDRILRSLSIPIEEVIGSGGGETRGTQRLRRALTADHWVKGRFEIKKTINGRERESQSHEIDHVREINGNIIALEIEWNNKDPFFDRDLENFKRLHAEGAISVGIIITRGVSLQQQMRAIVQQFALARGLRTVDDLTGLGLAPTARQRRDYERRVAQGLAFSEAWSSSFVQDKFGAATTHWRKLEDRVQRGVGNPCPLLLIGLPVSIVVVGE